MIKFTRAIHRHRINQSHDPGHTCDVHGTAAPSHVQSQSRPQSLPRSLTHDAHKPQSAQTKINCLSLSRPLSLSPFISPSIYAIAIWAKPPPSMATHCSAGVSSGAWTLHGEGSHSLKTGRLASPSVDVDGGLARFLSFAVCFQGCFGAVFSASSRAHVLTSGARRVGGGGGAGGGGDGPRGDGDGSGCGARRRIAAIRVRGGAAAGADRRGTVMRTPPWSRSTHVASEQSASLGNSTRRAKRAA